MVHSEGFHSFSSYNCQEPVSDLGPSRTACLYWCCHKAGPSSHAAHPRHCCIHLPAAQSPPSLTGVHAHPWQVERNTRSPHGMGPTNRTKQVGIMLIAAMLVCDICTCSRNWDVHMFLNYTPSTSSVIVSLKWGYRLVGLSTVTVSVSFPLTFWMGWLCMRVWSHTPSMGS